MKVRDDLLRRFAIAVAFAVVSLSATGLAIEWLEIPDGFGRLLAFLVIFPAPFTILLMRARCPACRYPFMYIGFLRLKWGAPQKRLDYCPHCRLPLDSEIAQVVPRE